MQQRITALRESMIEQTNIRFAVQAMYEDKIKAYLEPIGFYGLEQHHYMNFGGECWRISTNFSQRTAVMEAEITAGKWARRGLVVTHLIRIARFFGIDLTGWTP